MTDREGTQLSPDAAFSLLANETRFEIVRALWELYDPQDRGHVVKFADLYEGDAAVAFSELYDRVGYDDTGNFNYHLERLTDHFVRRTDGGYELTEAGFEVARAVIAGTVSDRPRVDPTEIEERCPRCEAPVVVDYDDHHLHVSCTECLGLWQNAAGDDGVVFTLPLPPTGLAERTLTEAFHATIAYNSNRIRSFVDGVCPDCSSVVETSVDVCETHDLADRGGCPACHRQHAVEVTVACTRCKSVSRGPLTIAILAHPAVTAFYHDHGLDHQFSTWESFGRAQTVTETVLDTDPLRVRVVIPCGDERLRVDLDASLAAVDVGRETGTPLG